MTRLRRPGTRPAGTADDTGTRPPLPREGAGGRRPAVPPASQVPPPPLTRRQAAVMLAGLAAFAAGFAAAGVVVAAGHGGSPAYWCLVSLGLFGVAALGVASPRTLADAGRPAVWSRAGLASVAEPVGLPVGLVAGGFYALLAIGVLGNVVLPLTLGGR